MSSFLNNTDRSVFARKLADGVMQRLFFKNRDVDVIITTKNDIALSEYLSALDETLSTVSGDSFKTITIGDVTLVANGNSDTLAIIPGNGLVVTGSTKDGKSLTFAMDPTLYEKLNGIEFGANNYEHPTYPEVPPGENYIRVSVDEYGHVYAADKKPMTIAEGGTGASTAEEARANLGAASTAEATASSAGLMSSDMFTFIQELMTSGPTLSAIPASYVHTLFPELYPSEGE